MGHLFRSVKKVASYFMKMKFEVTSKFNWSLHFSTFVFRGLHHNKLNELILRY